MKVLLAHPGTQYSYRLAVELQRNGALSAFHTGLAFSSDSWVNKAWKAVPSRWRQHVVNRRIEGLPGSQLYCYPVGELSALLQQRNRGDLEAIIHRRNENFQRAIPESAFATAQAVIGFDTSSWILAERCQKFGLPFILDQSIGHPNEKERVFRGLRDRFPEWTETIPQKPAALLECEGKEHALAKIIVAPSTFVKRTLISHGVVAEKIRIIPFGTDLGLFAPTKEPAKGPVKFLFAGSITARKGVPVLLEAWKRAGQTGRAELWLAGPGRLPVGVKVPDGVKLLGNLPRHALAEIMRRSHVFVFPSFFEGLAQVQLEALATGLPLIGTTASGAEDLVVEGETGFIVEPDDVFQLAARIKQLVEDQSGWVRMRECCLRARGRLSWISYGDRWGNMLSPRQGQVGLQ